MSTTDELEGLLDELIEAGVFEPSDGGTLQPTEPFQREREERRSAVSAMDAEAFEDTLETYGSAEAVDPSTVDTDTLGDAVAIYHTADSLAPGECLVAALALERIESAAATDGVPEGFVRLDGDDVETFMAANPAAVIYCWREDCEPCDGAKEALETLLEDGEIPDRVGLGAVYGPDWADQLREDYQVGVAPTTLFCVDGRVDSRIVGNPGTPAFRSEVRTIAESID